LARRAIALPKSHRASGRAGGSPSGLAGSLWKRKGANTRFAPTIGIAVGIGIAIAVGIDIDPASDPFPVEGIVSPGKVGGSPSGLAGSLWKRANTRFAPTIGIAVGIGIAIAVGFDIDPDSDSDADAERFCAAFLRLLWGNYFIESSSRI
jgi:hypothetical protein